MNKDTIFIPLNGFDEKELLVTVESAVKNSDNPDRLFFGIYEQRTDGKFEDFSEFENVKHVKVLTENLLGTGLARLNAYYLNNGERYCLCVDAHTVFNKGWDTYIVEYLKNLKSYADKPIISYRIPDFIRDENNQIVKMKSIIGNTGQYIQTFGRSTLALELESHISESGVSYSSIVIKDVDYENSLVHDNDDYINKVHTDIDRRVSGVVEHYIISGNFLFAETSFLSECVWDPEIFFYGEEEAISLRAVSRGYRIFVPDINYFYHKGKDFDENGFNYEDGEPSWRWLVGKRSEKFSDNEIKIDDVMNRFSSRLHRILSGKEFGYWGASDEESFRYFESKVGLKLSDVLIDLEESY